MSTYSDIDIDKVIEDFEKYGEKFASAKGEAIRYEHARKALLATLMMEAELSGIKSYQNQEKQARSDIRYINIVNAYSAAKHLETESYCKMEACKMKFEKWRTDRADLRSVTKNI